MAGPASQSSKGGQGLAAAVGLPSFLLRKLYRRGSLHSSAQGRFAFVLHNPLGTATLLSPPHIVVNGVYHQPSEIEADGVDLAAISMQQPFRFEKGAAVELRLKGHLLRGANRIHVSVLTQEFGEVEFLVEDSEGLAADSEEE